MQKYFYDPSCRVAMMIAAHSDGDIAVVVNLEKWAALDGDAQQEMINDLFAEHHLLGPVELSRRLKVV